MRTPIENGLASMHTPRSCSIANVSRALWPIASTTWSAAIVLAVRQHHAAHPPRAVRPGSMSISVDPRAEPVFAAQRLDRRAHALHHRHQPERADMRLAHVQDLRRRAGLRRTRSAPCGPRWRRVLDLAVQLAVGERAGAALAELHVAIPGRARRAATGPRCPSCARAPPCPRSRMIGRKPICASISAANRPHGPAPITTGRSANPSGARATSRYDKSGADPTSRPSPTRPSTAASSATSASTV